MLSRLGKAPIHMLPQLSDLIGKPLIRSVQTIQLFPEGLHKGLYSCQSCVLIHIILPR
jgi:hypothetical protein